MIFNHSYDSPFWGMVLRNGQFFGFIVYVIPYFFQDINSTMSESRAQFHIFCIFICYLWNRMNSSVNFINMFSGFVISYDWSLKKSSAIETGTMPLDLLFTPRSKLINSFPKLIYCLRSRGYL